MLICFLPLLSSLTVSVILHPSLLSSFFCFLLPDSSPSTPLPTDPAACPPPPPDLPWPMAVVGGNGGREAGKYCCLCGAWFNNPLMAQQHYEGKKHRRNAARARLLEQLAGSLDATESTGQPLGPEPNTSDKRRAENMLQLCTWKDDKGGDRIQDLWQWGRASEMFLNLSMWCTFHKCNTKVSHTDKISTISNLL